MTEDGLNGSGNFRDLAPPVPEPSSNPELPSCKSCKFWWPATADPPFIVGQCRRHAPITYAYGDYPSQRATAAFPITSDHDWCGDHHSLQKILPR